ncbi:MAG: nucleotidyl transferase AbiEii/AbiGii toxin family protein [Candidatus Saganbacteria bacterium]|nr:nucleotidyl transferase AbiEii/AbiGii toxin family protein [Candidatus Saganbacteria bacterium]
MLSRDDLEKFTNKYQTIERNIVREYLQHLFLANLYGVKGAEKLLFKGGTALRIAFLSPRFSEDVDFTGQNIYHHQEIDELFITALSEVEKMGINVYIKEAKPTTGGYLGLIHYEMFDLVEDMKFEVSLRKGKKAAGELVNVASEYIPSYSLIHLPAEIIAGEKLEAVLTRKKPRDYYDLYFMLRHPELNKYIDKKKMRVVSNNLKSERIDFKKELMVLLPASHQMLLKDFKGILKKEIEKYL